MVANVLKYKCDNLIILYCCTHSRLSDTTEVVVWNSIRLIMNAEFCPWVDR